LLAIKAWLLAGVPALPVRGPDFWLIDFFSIFNPC